MKCNKIHLTISDIKFLKGLKIKPWYCKCQKIEEEDGA
jgi:hypothetical protein